MTFKNKLAAVAVVSGLFLAGMANMAVAQVDLGMGAAPVPYSGNIVVPRTGLVLTNEMGRLNVVIPVPDAADFDPEDEDTFQINLELRNDAVFSGSIEIDVGTLADPDSHTPTAIEGRRLRNQAFFQGTIPATTGQDMDVLVFTIQPSTIEVANDGPVQMYLRGEVSFDDGSFSNITLFERTITYIAFAPNTISVSSGPGEPAEQIDVAMNSRFFTGGSPRTAMATITVSVAPHLDADTMPVELATLVENADVTLEAGNGLSAFQTIEGARDNGGRGITYSGDTMEVSEDGLEAGLANVEPEDLHGTPVADMNTGVTSGSEDLVLTVPMSNQRSIDPTPLTLEMEMTAPEGYNDQTFRVPLNSLTKNGSSDRLTFTLTPVNPAYPMFIRITNPSNVAGNVSLVLINDDGDRSGSIGIGEISGVASDELPARASTDLLPIGDVFDAAGTNFDLGDDSNKLRIEVDAEFGVTGTPSGVVLNGFAVSDDGSTFFMLTDASD